jgi:poly(ribitol-phosphate) beta-N-acetylglucosaminyltransferase
VPSESSFELHEDGTRAWVSFRASARIDPRTLGGGRPLTPGVWDAYARINQTGFSKQVRLGSNRTERASSALRTALLSGQLVTPYWTEPYGNLSLDVGAGPNRLLRELGHGRRVAPLRARHGASKLRVVVPLESAVVETPAARVVLTQRAPQSSIPLDISGVEWIPDGLCLTGELPPLAQGDWQVLVGLDVERWPAPRPSGVRLTVSESGHIAVAAETTPIGRQAPNISTALRRMRRSGRRRVGALRRRARRIWRR